MQQRYYSFFNFCCIY